MTPEGWFLCTLSEAVVAVDGLQTGPFGAQLHASDYVVDGVPVVMPKDLAGGKVIAGSTARVPEELAMELFRHRVLPGDILFGRRGDIGRCGLVGYEEEGWLCGTGCLRARVDQTKIFPHFLIQALSLPRTVQWMNDNAVGQTMLNLNTSILGKLPVLLPPPAEQRKIAAILSSVDDAIEATQAVIDQLGVVKKAMMAELLTRGLPGRHTRFKQTEIGEVPEEWEVVRLGELVDPSTVITYGIVQAGPHIENGVPYIRTGDVKAGGIDSGRLGRTSPQIAASFKRSEVRSGDLVFCIRASVGAVIEVPRELDGANLTQGTAKIAPGPRTDGRFLLWALRSDAVQSWIGLQCKGSTFREITLGRLRETPIPVPTKEEQTRIASAIDAVERRELTEAAKWRELVALKSALSSVLLTGEVRVTPDPDPEPHREHPERRLQ